MSLNPPGPLAFYRDVRDYHGRGFAALLLILLGPGMLGAWLVSLAFDAIGLAVDRVVGD